MLNELIMAVRTAAANRLRLPTFPHGVAPFAGQHFNHKRNVERKVRRAVGRRQDLRIQKSLRRALKEHNTCAAS